MTTVVELRKKAKELGLKGYSKLKKAELIELIEKTGVKTSFPKDKSKKSNDKVSKKFEGKKNYFYGEDYNFKISEEVKKLLKGESLGKKSFSNDYNLIGIYINVIQQLNKSKLCLYDNIIQYNIDKEQWNYRIGYKKSNLDTEKVKKWTEDCKADIISFYVSFNDGRGGHANMIVINKKLKTIELFEPHGSNFSIKTNAQEKLIAAVQKLTKNMFQSFEFLDPFMVCPRIKVNEPIKMRSNETMKETPSKCGIQKILNNLAPDSKLGASCAFWSLWYLNVRLSHPEMSAEKSLEKAMNSIFNRELPLDPTSKCIGYNKNDTCGKYYDTCSAWCDYYNDVGKNIEAYISKFIDKLVSFVDFKLNRSEIAVERDGKVLEKIYLDSNKKIDSKDKKYTKCSFYLRDYYFLKNKLSTENDSKYFVRVNEINKRTFNKLVSGKKSSTVRKKVPEKKVPEKKKSSPVRKISSDKCKGKKCASGKICNPKSGRCVDRNGKIGKQIKSS